MHNDAPAIHSGWLGKKQLVVWNAEMQGDFGRSYSWNPLEFHYHMILIYLYIYIFKQIVIQPCYWRKPQALSQLVGWTIMLPLFVDLGGFPFNYNPPTNVGTLPKKLTAKRPLTKCWETLQVPFGAKQIFSGGVAAMAMLVSGKVGRP